MFSLLPALGSGSGSHLPLPVLVLAGISTVVATVVSATSIFLHLRNYRKPRLQRYANGRCLWSSFPLITTPRMVIRIMIMVPLYAIASLISLFSLEAAFFIDAVRDIYEVSPLLNVLRSERTRSSSAARPKVPYGDCCRAHQLLGFRHLLLL